MEILFQKIPDIYKDTRKLTDKIWFKSVSIETQIFCITFTPLTDKVVKVLIRWASVIQKDLPNNNSQVIWIVILRETLRLTGADIILPFLTNTNK